MHTDYTLAILDSETTSIGKIFNKFVDKTCVAFNTQELKNEAEARWRWQAKQVATGGPSEQRASRALVLPKKMNRRTYKYHLLGDYAKMIRRLGTTDSVSTQPVSLLF